VHYRIVGSNPLRLLDGRQLTRIHTYMNALGLMSLKIFFSAVGSYGEQTLNLNEQSVH
jgi:hypothetical protein